MTSIKDILAKAKLKNQSALSEYESKLVLKAAGVPVTREHYVADIQEAKKKAAVTGYPVALKGCSHKLTHKTESGAVCLNISSDAELEKAWVDISGRNPGLEGFLVQEMFRGKREFLLGLMRDIHFGPCVMFGLGGIFTELFNDVSLRVAPLKKSDAEEMLDELKTSPMLGAFRGMKPAMRGVIIDSILALSSLGMDYDDIAEIDVNPFIISDDGKCAAVDGLIILKKNNGL